MAVSVKIDPITRIEGHLAVRLDIDGGVIQNAYIAGEMYRGFEAILQGRDPLDAQQITQRICGVCPISHAIASCAAQEAVYGIVPPDNGRLLRNLIQGANTIQSHVLHFYHLAALDYIDVQPVAEYKGTDQEIISLKKWMESQSGSGGLFPLTPFLPKYSGGYITDPELNIMFVKHYMDAFKIRSLSHQMGAVFAGKLPHAPSIIPGGVTQSVSVSKILQYKSILDQIRTFIDTVYIPDVIELAIAFPDYMAIGKGYGDLLSFGAYPENETGEKKLLTPGLLVKGEIRDVDPIDIREDVRYSYYSSASAARPFESRTTPDAKKQNAYSWLKAPRYQGRALEAGPLATVMVMYLRNENSKIRTLLDNILKKLGKTPQDMNSTLGRHIARAIQCKVIADRCSEWADLLIPEKPTYRDFMIPESGRGFGLTEAPRGALGHWIELEDRKIKTYQCIIPTTWNCSPRDDNGLPGPVEHALAGTSVADSENPLEAVRIVRAFDPCIACAVH